jgi:AcrR family transcriptional regulator
MDDKKKLIINIAENFFAHFGLKKTTMDEIAKKARMGKSTLYYYFSSKEAIFSEVIKRESLTLRNKIIEEVDNANSPQEKLSLYVITRMKFLRKLSNYYTALVDEYLDNYTFIENERASFNDFEVSMINSILRDGCNQGIFSVEDTQKTTDAILLALKGLEIPLIIEKEKSQLDDILYVMTNLLFKGIEKR